MNRALIAITLLAALQGALAQQQLPRKEALKYAFLVSVDLKKLQGTPIATDVDLKQPAAVRDGQYGAMVLPETKLSLETLAKARDQVAAIGQLWLHKLTPMKDGEGIPGSQLRLVTVEGGEESGTAVQCALGVKANDSGGLDLLVFGKDRMPLLKVPLKKVESAQESPLALEAERTNGDAGQITLKILGRYQAALQVTDLEE